MTTVPQLSDVSQTVAMNPDVVKVEHGDRGTHHRAIMVARALAHAGIWNGEDVITIFNPAVTFNKLFGFQDMPVTCLKSGVDYLIEAPVVLHSVRRELPTEPDGDVLWA